MLREFTQTVGRFDKGESRDYPQTTWDALAASVNKKLGTFTKELGQAPRTQVQQASTRRERHVT